MGRVLILIRFFIHDFYQNLLSRTGMKLDRHRNVRFEKDVSKLRSNNLVKYYQIVEGEFPTEYMEVVSSKRSITDSIPVLYNFFILANSKLHILRCIDFMINHLDTSALRFNYMDTDSFCLSLSKSLDDMVLPGMEDSWRQNKPNWFVIDESDIDQLREPGKFSISI